MDVSRRDMVRALRRARAEQGLTVADLADAAGLAPRTVYRLLAGQAVHWSTVLAVAEALRLEVGLVVRESSGGAR